MNPATEKQCPQCDAIIAKDAEVCPDCGSAQNVPPIARKSGGGKVLKGCLIAAVAGFFGIFVLGIVAAIVIPKFANTKQKAYITAMKSDLRNLVTSEEAYFSDSSSYTSTIGNLKYNSSTGVSSPSVTLGTGTQAGGWTATVSHSQMPSGFKCGVGVNMTNPTVSTAAEGEPACK